MREKTTRFVLLGALAAAGPLTGFDLRRWVGAELGAFWSESFGQIYPGLRELQAEGLVAAADRGGDGKPYRITPAGRAALLAWLSRSPRPERARSELLAKLHFGRFLGTESVRALLEAARRHASERLESVQAEAEALAQRTTGEERVFAQLTSERLLSVARAELAWAERALRTVEALEAGGPDAALATLA